MAIVLALTMIVTFLPVMALAEDKPNYFYVENLTDETATVHWAMTGSFDAPTLKYSADQSEWSDVTMGSGISLPAESKVYFKGVGNTRLAGENGFQYTGLRCDKNHAVGGDITTLLDGVGGIKELTDASTFYALFGHTYSSGATPPADAYTLIDAGNLILPSTTLTDFCYSVMFRCCLGMTTAPKLPATTLAPCCYDCMFDGCKSLETAPELPAMTMAEGCYENMFDGCDAMTKAPKLPATTLAKECYLAMFARSAGLTVAPDLPATTLAEGCYMGMFDSCENLETASTMAATTLADQCCYGMYVGCTGLKNVPDLPATTLTKECYREMFARCESLVDAPAILATTLAEECCNCMFYECTSLKNAPELPATALDKGCYFGMFGACEALEDAPELPATTLAYGCYNQMFTECTSLVDAPALPATTLEQECYSGMFRGCTNLKNAPELPAATLVDACYQEMFYGCEKLSSVTVGFTEFIEHGNATLNWLGDVAESGTLYAPGNFTKEFDLGSDTVPEDWNVVRAVYAVATDSCENGAVVAPASAVAGNTVTLTVTPDEGYALKELNVTYNDGEDKTCDVTSGEENAYTFTMPEADVTVSATFEEAAPHVHHLVKVDGQAATEKAAGFKEYYECKDADDACGALFEDKEGKTPIDDLAAWKAEGGNGYIAPLAHVHNLVKVAGQPATEQAAGFKDYYECKDADDACGAFFEDKDGKTPIDDLDAWKAEGGAGYLPKMDPSTVLGDVNGDGLINMKDVLTLRKHLAEIEVATFEEASADCHQDNVVDMKDVLALRRYLVGITTEFGPDA